MSAVPVPRSVEQGDHRGDRGLGTGQVVVLGDGGAHRWAVPVAGEPQRTASGRESQPFYFDERDPRPCSQTWQVLQAWLAGKPVNVIT